MGATQVVIGVDVGGTGVVAGLVSQAGDILASVSLPARAADADCLAQISQAITTLVTHPASGFTHQLVGIGLGVAGAIDFRTGCVSKDALNLPELAGVPLAARFQERFGAPVYVDNDVNALALGEMLFGAAKGVKDFVYLALGTGVGGGIVANGQLVRGARGFAGEVGHATVNWDGRDCFCGGRGCLKAYAAGPDIAAQAREHLSDFPDTQILRLVDGDPRSLTAAHVFAAAQAGDELGRRIAERAAQALGAAVGNLLNILNPATVILGGSVAQGAAFLLERIQAWAKFYALASAFEGTPIVLSSFGKEAALLGPAALCWMELARQAETARA